MVYDAWSNYLEYIIQNYPGSGYVCLFQVYWKPGMQKDFRDIRWVDGNDTVLPYWIESYTTSSARVWIRTSTSPTVFMYYGNGSVVSESNGNATFDFFDDAESGVPSDKWRIASPSGGSVTYVTDSTPGTVGTKVIKINGVAGGQVLAVGKNISVASGVFEARIKMTNTASMFCAFASQTDQSTYAYRPDYGTLGEIYRASSGGVYTFLSQTTGPSGYPSTVWANWKIAISETGYIRTFYNDNQHMTLTDTSLTSGSIGLRAVVGSVNNTVSADNVRIRKYTALIPTPVFVSAGHRVPASRHGCAYWNLGYRESGLSVPTPALIGSRMFSSMRPVSCSIPASNINVSRLSDHPRATGFFVPALNTDVSRKGDHPRAAGFSVSRVDVTSSRTASLDVHAGMSVPGVYDLADSVLRHIPPNYPYAVTLEFEGEQVVSDQITAYDTVDIRGTLYDTDPVTDEQRQLPLAGFVVKAVIHGGSPARTIVKDCIVLSGGQVTFTLSSSDTSVPGKYVCKFVVLGDHFSVTGYRKELPEKRADVPLIRVNDSRTAV